MKKNYYLLYVLSLLFLASCSNEDLDLGTRDSPDTEKSGSIEFIYKGELYSSTYFTPQDSLIILNDNIANEVYRNLGLNPNLAVVVNDDGVLTYYDSYDEISLLSAIGDNTSTQLSLRSTGNETFTVDMFEDSSYNGKRISFTITKKNPKIYIPSLGAHGMNDKISSLKYRLVRDSDTSPWGFPFVFSFTLFQHDNYQGQSITFTSTFMFPSDAGRENTVRRLKEVSMGSGRNWNDVASSAIIGQ